MQDIIVFFDRMNVLNTVVGECTILTEHWYARGLKYRIPTTLVSSELIQCIQTSPNVSLETDMVAEISQMFPPKALYRRSNYGYKKVLETEQLIPSDCDPEEVIEFIVL